ncbi:MAG: AraC family transcriptional regulator [Verrucomicrobiota bacterium]
MREKSSNNRYLAADPEVEKWGWQIVDAGAQSVEPGVSYPPEKHPQAYLFGADGRRTLMECQIVLLTSGTGQFQSRSQRTTRLGAGDAFVLFPGEWHRYRPDPGTGWKERWVGFQGREALRLVQEFLPRSHPIYPSAGSSEMNEIFQKQYDYLNNVDPGSEQVAASLIPQQIALLRRSRIAKNSQQSRRREIIVSAKAAILSDLSKRTDFTHLATEIGLSYSRFRRIFQSETGHAPREFENVMKLTRGRELLSGGRHNVSSVADLLGYSSVYYFSRAYKKHFGRPPSQDSSII